MVCPWGQGIHPSNMAVDGMEGLANVQIDSAMAEVRSIYRCPTPLSKKWIGTYRPIALTTPAALVTLAALTAAALFIWLHARPTKTVHVRITPRHHGSHTNPGRAPLPLGPVRVSPQENGDERISN